MEKIYIYKAKQRRAEARDATGEKWGGEDYEEEEEEEEEDLALRQGKKREAGGREDLCDKAD